MTVARLAISMDADLARAVRRAAGDESTSAWLADAARRKLRADGLLDVVRDWEREHGELTQAEVRSVTSRPARRRRRSTR